MISRTVASFWRLYYELPPAVRHQARQAYLLFNDNPDHPSLRFKKLQGTGDFWSVRLAGEYRAICRRDGATVTWVWIGTRQSFGKEI